MEDSGDGSMLTQDLRMVMDRLQDGGTGKDRYYSRTLDLCQVMRGPEPKDQKS